MLGRLKRQLSRSYGLRFAVWLFVHNFVDLAAKYSPLKKRQKSERKRILFLRPEGIGDYVLWTGTFAALEKAFPSEDYERVLLGNKLWKKLAEGEAVFDEHVFIDPPRILSDPAYRYKTFREIRTLNADIVVNCRLSREFVLTDSIVRTCGASERIGTHGIANRMNGLQKAVSDRWYTRLTDPPSRDDHEQDSALKLIGAITGYLGNAERHELASSEIELSELDTTDYAVLFVGAQVADKQWPIERFAETAQHVSANRRLRVVLAGGPDERKFVAQFPERFHGEFVDMVGKLDLAELSELVRRASLVITNDTGAGHIGVSFARPTVVITPGNHVGRFFPYPAAYGVPQISVTHPLPCFGCDWHCKFENLGPDVAKPCVAEITVSEVNAAIDQLLD